MHGNGKLAGESQEGYRLCQQTWRPAGLLQLHLFLCHGFPLGWESEGFHYRLPAISLVEPRGLKRNNFHTRVFSFPTSPCPALYYANQQYLGKAKAILLYSHLQISTFLCMTSRLARDAKSVFSQHLPELKLKAPCCSPQAFFPTLHWGLCPP